MCVVAHTQHVVLRYHINLCDTQNCAATPVGYQLQCRGAHVCVCVIVYCCDEDDLNLFAYQRLHSSSINILGSLRISAPLPGPDRQLVAVFSCYHVLASPGLVW